MSSSGFRGPASTSPVNTALPPMTLDEMWSFLVAQRGFNAAPSGRGDRLRQRPASVSFDPKGKGPPIGPGYQTFAAIQVISADGKAWAIGTSLFSGGNKPHAEDDAVRQMEIAILQKVKDGVDRFKGGRILALVDQEVCDRCQGRLQQLAIRLKLVNVEAYVPERPNLRGAGIASPKTTMRTALSALRDGKGNPIKAGFRLSFSMKFQIPKGIFKFRLPKLTGTVVKSVGAGLVALAIYILGSWLRGMLDSRIIERQVEGFRPQIEAALDEQAEQILKIMNDGKVPYANVSVEIFEIETLDPEPGGPPIRSRTLPHVSLQSVSISDRDINDQGPERRKPTGVVTEVTSIVTFSFQIGVIETF